MSDQSAEQQYRDTINYSLKAAKLALNFTADLIKEFQKEAEKTAQRLAEQHFERDKMKLECASAYHELKESVNKAVDKGALTELEADKIIKDAKNMATKVQGTPDGVVKIASMKATSNDITNNIEKGREFFKSRLPQYEGLTKLPEAIKKDLPVKIPAPSLLDKALKVAEKAASEAIKSAAPTKNISIGDGDDGRGAR